MIPKAFKIQAGTSPDPPKSRPEPSMTAKMHPRCLQEPFRSVQKALKVAQELPKTGQEEPKSRPMAAQEVPKPVQNRVLGLTASVFCCKFFLQG